MGTQETRERAEAPQPAHGTVNLYLSADGMEAAASITPPRHGGEPVTVQHVLEELAKQRVCFGVDLEAVERLVERTGQQPEGVAGPRVVIARGRPPVHGQDGRTVPHELLQTPAGYPQQREDGTVDFFELNMVRNVAEGTVLVTRRPPTKGEAGSDVQGRAVAARDGAEVRLKAGKGAKLSADGHSVIAATGGHASISAHGEVVVSPIFSVADDVDFHTGNIDFIGTVVIQGDVNPGFTVRAAHNVEVHGGILGGVVEAGGDVIVRYGICGGKPRVVAGGKVEARFVEGAEIIAGLDLNVVDGILHAQVSAGGKVTLSGTRGSIIGGQIRARTEVNCRILGSPAGTVTEVLVGISPEKRAEMEQTRAALRQVEERLLRAAQTVKFLRDLEARSPEAVTPSHKQMVQQAQRGQNQSRLERDKLQSRLAELQAEFDQTKSAAVRAFDLAHPGVRLVLGSERFPVLDLHHRTCFFLSEEGVIATAPL